MCNYAKKNERYSPRKTNEDGALTETTDQDRTWLIDQMPYANADELWFFADKVSFLVGMCGYDLEESRKQAYTELLDKKNNGRTDRSRSVETSA
jgi:hypothetical protein